MGTRPALDLSHHVVGPGLDSDERADGASVALTRPEADTQTAAKGIFAGAARESRAIAETGVSILEGQLKTADGAVDDQFLIEVRSADQLDSLSSRVLKVPGVTSVRRMDDPEDE